jgi:hypothetical protein
MVRKTFLEIFIKFITPIYEKWTIINVLFGNFIDSFFEEIERFSFLNKNSGNFMYFSLFYFDINDTIDTNCQILC